MISTHGLGVNEELHNLMVLICLHNICSQEGSDFMNYSSMSNLKSLVFPCEETFDIPGSGQVLVPVAQGSAAQLSQGCASEELWTQTYPCSDLYPSLNPSHFHFYQQSLNTDL